MFSAGHDDDVASLNADKTEGVVLSEKKSRFRRRRSPGERRMGLLSVEIFNKDDTENPTNGAVLNYVR